MLKTFYRNGKQQALLYACTLFLLCMLSMPSMALESHQLNDSEGRTDYLIYNPVMGEDILAGYNLLDKGAEYYSYLWKPLGYLSGNSAPDYVVKEESQFFTFPTDRITEVRIKINVQKDEENIYYIPFSYEADNSSAQYYIKIYVEEIGVSRFPHIALLDANQSLIVDNPVVSSSFAGSPVYLKFTDNEFYLSNNGFDGKDSSWYNVLSVIKANITEINFDAANNVKFDISGYPENIDVTLRVFDGYEYQKQYDSVVMGTYWVITRIIPDNNNVIYNYFLAMDTGFYLMTLFIMAVIGFPFAYLFFACFCGMFVCVMRGTFKGGFPAGIKTTIHILQIPIGMLKYVFYILTKLIEAIKP